GLLDSLVHFGKLHAVRQVHCKGFARRLPRAVMDLDGSSSDFYFDYIRFNQIGRLSGAEVCILERTLIERTHSTTVRWSSRC
ncbi:MAG: hypothetical protein AB8B56_17025, partial [Crocinitomicaceae bacterium]